MSVRCSVCNKPLKSEASRAIGMGPACSKKAGKEIPRTVMNPSSNEPIERSHFALEPVEINASLHAKQRRLFSEIDWTDEKERERVLSIWRENRGFDGIFISQDDDAWKELREKAAGDWEYQLEGALGGTGNSFGIEIEFEMPTGTDKSSIAKALQQANLIDHTEPYKHHHEGESTPGLWKLEVDESLSNGLELISPILFDRKEHWQQIEIATKTLRNYGCTVNWRTGGHIHIGIAPLDHRTYAWQRLTRIGLAYEHQFYKMGGADSESYAKNGRPGIHRGTEYADILPDAARSIQPEDSAAVARNKLTLSRNTIFNALNVDASSRRQKPTLEMRYPNGTLDHRQIQAHVIVANAVVHQAAVIREESQQSEFIPRLHDKFHQLRYYKIPTQEEQEANFRKFLDVLGNPNDRFAATWLYLRGKVSENETQ